MSFRKRNYLVSKSQGHNSNYEQADCHDSANYRNARNDVIDEHIVIKK